MPKVFKFGFLALATALLSGIALGQNECTNLGLQNIVGLNVADSSGVVHQPVCWNPISKSMTFPIGITSAPFYLNAGTPTSQGNECAAITKDTLGNTVTAVAALRTIDNLNVGHDVACVITADSVPNGNIGAFLFPFVTAISSVAGPSQGSPGVLEVANNTGPRLILTNTSTTNRTNTLSFRSGVGGFGTDMRMVTDSTGIGNEDMTWFTGTSQAVLYVTLNCGANCGNGFAPAGTRQFLISDGGLTATTNPPFGIAAGHLAHGTTSSNLDNWGTATCAANTVTVTFVNAFSNTSYKVMLTDQTTKGGANVTTKNTGSMVISCTGATDVVDYLVLGHPF